MGSLRSEKNHTGRIQREQLFGDGTYHQTNECGPRTSGYEVFTFSPLFLLVLEFSVFAVCVDSLAPSLTYVHFGECLIVVHCQLLYRKNLGFLCVHLKWAKLIYKAWLVFHQKKTKHLFIVS